jgi:hypothetical protein
MRRLHRSLFEPPGQGRAWPSVLAVALLSISGVACSVDNAAGRPLGVDSAPGDAGVGGATAGPKGSGARPAAAASAGGPAPTAVGALIGDAACDTDAQCRTVAVGSKPCGGPDAYLAWSTLRTDEQALLAAAAREAAASKAAAQAQGMVSNCALVTDPGAFCAQASAAASTGGAGSGTVAPKVCRLRSRGAGGSAVY